ncbi:MAG: hypothetical protein M1839_000529 [Geoglossum umbratile]|nr:MAG: hypothetical protein M1839_000529 [Geoglossum umbratile]
MGAEMDPEQPAAPASRRRTPLSLDLSSLPPLIQPSPPSNTLLITNLIDPEIFHPSHLLTIRDLINESAPIHSWSPLKSLRRIIVSFHSTDAAIRIRQLLDGEYIMNERVRIYFGEATPIKPVDQHLHLPQSQKLFFISPPPSPPHGWEIKQEGPPNKDVHPEDLVTALSRLHATRPQEPSSPVSPQDEIMTDSPAKSTSDTASISRRQRSGSSTMIYHPEDHGDSPHLPAIAVEDLTAEDPGDLSLLAQREEEERIQARTARPPVELMADA